MQLLTNSRRNSFGSCHRKHLFEYEQGIRPVSDALALAFGDLVHKGLEAWYLNHWQGIEVADREACAAIAAHGKALDPYVVAVAHVLLEEYSKRYGADEMEVVAVEQFYAIPLVNPATRGTSRTFQLAGKLDAIVRKAGRVFIVEHKTTSEDLAPDARYWAKLSMDGQVSGYYMGAQSLGWDADGCEYDAIRKPSMRPNQVALVDDDGAKIVLDANGERVRTKDGKKWRETASTADGWTLQTRTETVDEFRARIRADIAADPDRHFRRHDVHRTDADLVEYLSDVWAVGREIADAQVSGRWPRNPRSCDVYSGCPFFEVCSGRESIDNPHYFKRGPIHPELEGFAETLEADNEDTTTTEGRENA